MRVRMFNPQMLELAFVKGYDSGFALCHDIDDGTCPSPEAAKARFGIEKKLFLDSCNINQAKP